MMSGLDKTLYFVLKTWNNCI